MAMIISIVVLVFGVCTLFFVLCSLCFVLNYYVKLTNSFKSPRAKYEVQSTKYKVLNPYIQNLPHNKHPCYLHEHCGGDQIMAPLVLPENAHVVRVHHRNG